MTEQDPEQNPRQHHSGSRWEPSGPEAPGAGAATPGASAAPPALGAAQSAAAAPAGAVEGAQTLPPPPSYPPHGQAVEKRRLTLPRGLRGRLLVAAAALLVLLLVMALGFALGRITAPDPGGHPDWPTERDGFTPGDRGGLSPGAGHESGDEAQS